MVSEIPRVSGTFRIRLLSPNSVLLIPEVFYNYLHIYVDNHPGIRLRIYFKYIRIVLLLFCKIN